MKMKAKLFSEIKYYKEDQHMNNQPIKSDEKRRSCRTLHFSGNLQHLSFIFDDFVLFTVVSWQQCDQDKIANYL